MKPVKKEKFNNVALVFPDGDIASFDLETGLSVTGRSGIDWDGFKIDLREHSDWYADNTPASRMARVPSRLFRVLKPDGTVFQEPDPLLRAALELSAAARYRKAGRGKCPHCWNDHGDEGEVHLDDGYVWVDFCCTTCGRYWQENFELRSVTLYPGAHDPEDAERIIERGE